MTTSVSQIRPQLFLLRSLVTLVSSQLSMLCTEDSRLKEANGATNRLITSLREYLIKTEGEDL
jgi:hypothetical protein